MVSLEYLQDILAVFGTESSIFLNSAPYRLDTLEDNPRIRIVP